MFSSRKNEKKSIFQQVGDLATTIFAVVVVSVVVVAVVVALKQNNHDILADSFSRISGCKTGLAQMEQNYFMRHQIILRFFIRVN